MTIQICTIKERDCLDYKKIRLEMVNLYPQYFDVDRAKLNSLTDEEWMLNVIDTIQNSNNRKFLAYDKDRCIGMISCEITNNIMTIGSFYVVLDYRRKGIGKKLMDKCFELSETRGCDVCKLWVSTVNKSALGWYKRLGFQSTEPPILKKFDHLELYYEECLVKF